MAFENGFNPSEHFEPIVNCLKSNEKIINSIDEEIDKYSTSKNTNIEDFYEKIRNILCNDYAYSCLRQLVIYNEDEAEQIWGQKMPSMDDILKKRNIKNTNIEYFFKWSVPKIRKIINV